MFEKLSNEIIRFILNKLDINQVKNMCITHSSIYKLNYKYFLLSYKILNKFFCGKIPSLYISDEIKDWIYFFDYSLNDYLNDLSNTLDDLKFKKKYRFKYIIPIKYNIPKCNLDINRKLKYSRVHYIYDNLQIATYHKIKKHNYNILALL